VTDSLRTDEVRGTDKSRGPSSRKHDRRGRVNLRSILRARPRERCQFENSFYRYDWPYNLLRGVRHRTLLFLLHTQGPVGRGRPSSYQVGDWVRVKDPEAIRATLDSEDRLRGLWFTTDQWAYCGRTYPIERIVGRMLDDDGRMRSISRTVALAGAVCDGPDGSIGCGRACSLYFRDEWLEPSSAAAAEAPQRQLTARVKPLVEIEATLDRRGRLGGISFSPEMAAYTEKHWTVLRRAEDLWIELPRWKKPRGEWYVLDGVRCSGQVLGGDGACDRNCGFLWHRAWIEIDVAMTGDLPTACTDEGT